MFKIKEKKYIFSLIIIIAGVVLSSLLPPQVLRIIIDNYLMKGITDGLVLIGMIYFGTFLLSGFFDFLEGYILTIVGQKIIKTVRLEMEEKLMKMKTGYFTTNSSGMIASKFINDVDNISALFTDGVVSLSIDCLKIIGIIGSIWLFSWQLGIFALCLVPLAWVITHIFRKKMYISQQNNLVELGKVNNHISESIKNIIMIKTFNREKYMEERYKSYLEENYVTMDKVSFYDSCYSPVIQVITACAIGLVLYISSAGSSNILNISIGEITASITLIVNLFSPIDSLGMELQSIQKGISGIHSVKEFMAKEEESPKEQFSQLYGEKIIFSFEDVSFSYDEGENIIENFNLTIEPGENVAFVGRTGAGKSTLFKLIIGLLRPTSGRITLNGIDAYRISSKGRRKIFGYVEQNFSFITGNVYDQISLGDDSISHEEIKKALDFVGLTSYIDNFPEKFHSQVNSEMFSMGQSQLLAIARAIVLSPQVLLLDEVTANLDAVTEEKVVEVLKKASSGKTILSIAHRQSTINKAERIIKL